MEITNLNKEEILKLSNKAGAYEFGRQKGYQDGFQNGCRSGVKQAKEDFKPRLNGVIHLSKMEIQSGSSRVRNAEGLICQLPETHEGRNSWLMNYGVGKTAKDIRENDSEKRKEDGYSPRNLKWNNDTDCLHGTGD